MSLILSAAEEEALDIRDPLRHLRDDYAVVPVQPPSVLNQNIQLSFPRSREPLVVQLFVDASPGCGGVAWPAGEVRVISFLHYCVLLNIRPVLTYVGARQVSCETRQPRGQASHRAWKRYRARRAHRSPPRSHGLDHGSVVRQPSAPPLLPSKCVIVPRRPLLEIMKHNVALNSLTASVSVLELNWSA